MKQAAIAALFAVSSAFFLFRAPSVRSQSAADPNASRAAVRIRLGVSDKAPSKWNGAVRAEAGKVTELRLWHPRKGDRVEGVTNFAVETRQGPLFVKRPWEQPFEKAQDPYLTVPGLVVELTGSPTARVSVETAQGRFAVSPFAIEAGQTQRFLDGRVLVDRVPASETISTADTDADFATVAAHPSGEAWTAWVEFANGADRVMARRFDGRTWAAPVQVSTDHNDIFIVKAARDGKGGTWFLWSAQVNGNFDVYGRRWNGTAWSAVERLSDDAQPDIYPVAATDADGNAWVAWQGFRNGKSDIFARRYNGSSWSTAERVSTSPANDWQPAIAADKAGRVWIGWDTYDKGNYDIAIRSWANGKWDAQQKVVDTPRFETYVTLACDEQNRLWVAWNEGGFEWGKDTGFIPKQQGTPLYADRWLNLAVLEKGEWKKPAQDLNAALPRDMRSHNDLPSLAADGAGRMWVFFRHRTARIRDIPNDAPNHRSMWEINAMAYEGSHWSHPVAFPGSEGRQDIRAGFAAGAPGTLWAAFPTDRRDFEEFLYSRSAVKAASLPVPSRAGAPPVLVARGEEKLETPQIHPKETEDLARIHGEAWPLDGKTYRIYRGDTHRHTEFSMDGNNDGTLLDAYRYAIDAAALDYLMVSEHNGAGGPDNEYPRWLLQQMVDVFTLPGAFVPLYGYERSVVYPNGHRNVIFAKRGNPTLPIPQAEQQGREGAAALYAYLKKYGGIAISHTSATSMGTDWRDNDPEVEPLVEIYQGDRVSAEYEGAPRAAYSATLSSAPGNFRPKGYVWNAWAKGYKLGVQAASDHLSTHISYACTIATDFTRQGLIDAMKLRHSYGSTDNIVLDYRALVRGKQYLQGEAIRASGPVQLIVNVKGTRPIRQIDIVRDNEFIHTRHPLTQEVNFTYRDTKAVGARESYYYVRVQQVDDQIAWSSPIWMKK
ncbi:MAG: DUF3604 domain-containing protein [Bryobacteraceae bacterium]